MPLTNINTNLQKLTRTNGTSVAYAGNSLSTGGTGIGGLDTGAVANSTLYYVYQVIGGIVASTSATAPSGFSSYRKVGAFYTDSTGQIFKAFYYGEVAQLVFSAKVTSAGVVSDESSDWITGNGTNANPRVLTVTGFSVAPNVALASVANSNNGTASAPTVTATSISIFTRNTDTTPQTDFQIVAHKQGIDASQPDWT